MCPFQIHQALWLSVYAIMHENIMFNQSDHEPPCCSNTESQHARVTGGVKWRVMTPEQRRGLAAMTLKHGTPHSAPVKCLKKAFPTPSEPAGGMNHPHAARSPTCLFNILLWLLSVSHLSPATTLHSGAGHIIRLLSDSIMHRIMAYGPHNFIVHISENSVAWPQGGSRRAAWVGLEELVLQWSSTVIKNTSYSYSSSRAPTLFSPSLFLLNTAVAISVGTMNWF